MRHKEHLAGEQDHLYGKPLRLFCHSFAAIEGLSTELRSSYSAMKYGKSVAVREWGKALTTLILAREDVQAIHSEHGELYLCSSAYGSVPTAATLLADEVAAGLLAAGWKVTKFKIDRHDGFERTNYGALGGAARARVIRDRKISLHSEVVERLNGKFALVIDDIRCTGMHEMAIADLLGQLTKVDSLAFAYCLSMEGPIKPGMEERLNQSAIRQASDLIPMFANFAEPPPINARMLKFVLLQGQGAMADFCRRLPQGACLRLYEAALSADGYFDKPKFREGFAAMEDYLFRSGAIQRRMSFATRNTAEKRIVVWNLGESATGGFQDMETGADLSELIVSYSKFKFGDVDATLMFARIVAFKVIATLEAGGTLREIFEQAASEEQFVSMISPGVRNVVSSSNYLMREVGQRVNVWLTAHGLPTMILRTLGRLGSGRANYAMLDAKQRAGREKKTQTILPRSEYQDFPTHLVFLDDVEVTGTTLSRTRNAALKAGARSFHAILPFKVDPRSGLQDAGIEHRMNHFAISESLDAAFAQILGHPDYQPVQRSLRLLLHPRNQSVLEAFLETHVGDKVLLRIYLGAMGNDYLWIHQPPSGGAGEYAAALAIVKRVALRRKLLDANGLCI